MRVRPNNYEVKEVKQLKEWFKDKPEGFCYVNGKVRQCWYIGHNSLVINGNKAVLDFKDLAGGVWMVTATIFEKENGENAEKETKDTEGN